jgi:hypothetical protein
MNKYDQPTNFATSSFGLRQRCGQVGWVWIIFGYLADFIRTVLFFIKRIVFSKALVKS